MKFSVGDRVRVVSHSQADRVMDEGRSAFVPAMSAYCGQEAVITQISIHPAYKIGLDRGFFLWDDFCFEDEAVSPLAEVQNEELLSILTRR